MKRTFKKIRNIVVSYRTLSFSLASLLLFSLGSYALASFSPGQTIDPSCSPSDPTCYVELLAITSTITNATQGSVLFAGSSGALTQDNSNFFWDDTNNRLGIGTATPNAALELRDTAEQLRLGHDANNYLSTTIDSSGNATFNLTASSGTPGFTFSDNVGIGTAPSSSRSLQTAGPIVAGSNGAFMADNPSFGELPAGSQVGSTDTNYNIVASASLGTAGAKTSIGYYTGGAGGWKSALEIAHTSGGAAGELQLVKTLGTVGIGLSSNSPAAKLHVISPSEQLRLGYNTTNYLSTTVGSTGVATFDVSGTAPGFTFNDTIGLGSGANIALNSNWLTGNGTSGKGIYINSNGNIGLKTSDIESWDSGTLAVIEGTDTAVTFGIGPNTTVLSLYSNAYFDGSSTKYKTTNEAANYYMDNGTHVWRTAASGTIDTTLTWTQAMKIDTSANLMVGTASSASAKLHVLSTTEQLRLGYDTNNYFSTTVDGSGNTTFNLTASSGTPKFAFSDDVTFVSSTNSITTNFGGVESGNLRYAKQESLGTTGGWGGGFRWDVGKSGGSSRVGMALGTLNASGNPTLVVGSDAVQNLGGIGSPTGGATGIATYLSNTSGDRYSYIAALATTLASGGSETNWIQLNTFSGTNVSHGVRLGAQWVPTGGGYSSDFVVNSTKDNSNVTEKLRVKGDSGNVGIGTGTTVSAKLHVISATEQLRLGYDASKYYTTTVSSAGGVTFDTSTTGQGFSFNDNVGIDTTPSSTYELDVAGDIRLSGELYYNNADIEMYNDGTTYGNVIIGNTVNSIGATTLRSVIIGDSNDISANTSAGYAISIGYLNEATANVPGIQMFGHFNSVASQYCKVFGVSNTGTGCQHGLILGIGNTVNTANTVQNGAPFVIGNNNTLTHTFGMIMGTNQTSTASGQLIIAQQQGNVTDGYNDVYFGSGPVRLTAASAYMSDITINGNGAADDTDKNAGSLVLAGGKATGAGTGGDVYLSTTSVLSSGTTRQSLSKRLVVKYDTGNVGIGTGTSASYRLDVAQDSASTYAAKFFNNGNNANRYGILVQAGLDDNTAAGPSTLIGFADGDGTSIGSITFGSSAVAYNTTSDQRLKENIVNTSVSIDTLNQIQIRDFTWKNDPTHAITHGVVAQELYEVYPQAVTKPIDENTTYWMVDYSKLVPLAVKAIQDLDVKITALDPNTNTSFAQKFVAFLGNAGNGIGDLFASVVHAGRVQTDQLCVGSVCVSEQQFLQMVQNNGSSSSTTSANPEAGSASGDGQTTDTNTDTTTQNDTTVTDTSTDTNTDNTDTNTDTTTQDTTTTDTTSDDTNTDTTTQNDTTVTDTSTDTNTDNTDTNTDTTTQDTTTTDTTGGDTGAQ